MKSRCSFAVLVVLASPFLARAEHASIDLQISQVDPASGTTRHERASSDQEPPPGGNQRRPVLNVKARQPLTLQFIYQNTYPHGDVRDASVQYFAVPVEKTGQKTVPDLKDAVTQGKFTMNFKPKAKVGARLSFTIQKPGVYLVRVQAENTNSDHEHFSAIDLVVE
jgi:hypothetical protein